MITIVLKVGSNGFTRELIGDPSDSLVMSVWDDCVVAPGASGSVVIPHPSDVAAGSPWSILS